MTVPEYRVIYRRDGGDKQYRVFQRLGTARRFIDNLRKKDREDLAPLVKLDFETRECGAWSPVPPAKARQ